MTDTMPVKSENAEGYDRETPCALIEFAIPELEQQAPETPPPPPEGGVFAGARPLAGARLQGGLLSRRILCPLS